MGEPALLADERFATPRDRRRHAEALVQAIERLAATRTRDEWAAVFKAHDVWWAPINSVDDVVHDPQAIAAGAFTHVPVHAGEATPEAFNGVATPVDFGATPSRPAGPSPRVGADAAELLGGLGLDAAAVARLRDAGVLG